MNKPVQLIPVRGCADRKKTSCGVKLLILDQFRILLILRLLEERQDVFVAPARISETVPLVVVLLAAADVQHPVDDGSAADHFPAVPGARVAVHREA